MSKEEQPGVDNIWTLLSDFSFFCAFVPFTGDASQETFLSRQSQNKTYFLPDFSPRKGGKGFSNEDHTLVK